MLTNRNTIANNNLEDDLLFPRESLAPVTAVIGDVTGRHRVMGPITSGVRPGDWVAVWRPLRARLMGWSSSPSASCLVRPHPPVRLLPRSSSPSMWSIRLPAELTAPAPSSLSFRSIVPDVDGLVKESFAPAPAGIDASLVCQVLLSALVALLTAFLMVKRDEQLATMSGEPQGTPLAARQGLPFPGELVDGVHEVVHHNINDLSRAGLHDLCNAFHLAKTGNKATLTERLEKFSADRKGWDSLLPSARNKHHGLRGSNITKNMRGTLKKKASVKQSVLQHELLFSATANGTGSMSTSSTQLCLPTERLDMRTDEEVAAVLAWVRPLPTSLPSPLSPP
ncbi:hypothetical protein BJY52DRAFT_1252407 [Lactarius psammicola]|nr:hypothetical protein BJY52DRAFT_1252407 [Lactarius psammicola]